MDEASARAAIVRVCALLWQRGLVAGSSGNVSYRLADGALLVTPTLRALRDLHPEEIVVLAPDGTDPSGAATSELPLHLAAYRVRADIACVVHTHPPYATGWSKTGRLFPLDTVGASESLGPIAFTAYAKQGSQELAERCATAFAAGAGTVVMERHGISCVAATLDAAFERSELTEQTAQIELCAALLRGSQGSPGTSA
jgi:ribulose-5-phosphate 4-epimerase/fuculose-1-phosphate aldolase